MVNKITACTFSLPNRLGRIWKHLTIVQMTEVSLSPTMEIGGPHDEFKYSVEGMYQRTNENLEALICSAIVLSRAEDVSNSDILTQQER